MKQIINKVAVDGFITEECMYVNMESPRYNLQTFLMEKVWNNHNFWDESARNKCDHLIKETDNFYLYEDAEGVVYNIRKQPELETAMKVCSFLRKYRFKCEMGDRCDRPERILRNSWYVDRLVERRFDKCIHIALSTEDDYSLGFLAIIDGGRIMSGTNCMVMDAFSSIALEFGVELSDLCLWRDGWAVYADDGGDDACVICPSYESFEEYIKEFF